MPLKPAGESARERKFLRSQPASDGDQCICSPEVIFSIALVVGSGGVVAVVAVVVMSSSGGGGGAALSLTRPPARG
jgi:hypothetical protein